jgi:hypothetical protein
VMAAAPRSRRVKSFLIDLNLNFSFVYYTCPH